MTHNQSEAHGMLRGFRASSDDPSDNPSCDLHPRFSKILACALGLDTDAAVVAHATAIAEIMGARLILLRIFDTPQISAGPPDALAWSLRCAREISEFKERVDETGIPLDIEYHVASGVQSEIIGAFVRENGVDLTVIGTARHPDGGHVGPNQFPGDVIGAVTVPGLDGEPRFGARSFPPHGSGPAGAPDIGPDPGVGRARCASTGVNRGMRCGAGSVLVVPAANGAPQPSRLRYRRILVPLDSSPAGEAALPVALGIADAHGSMITIAHAVPHVELTEAGPLSAEDLTLREQVHDRNLRAGRRYLERLLVRLSIGNRRPECRLLDRDEPRKLLMRSISEEHADLVILSARGLGRCSEAEIGSTASFLTAHSSVPVLLVRGDAQRSYLTGAPRMMAAPPRPHGDTRI